MNQCRKKNQTSMPKNVSWISVNCYFFCQISVWYEKSALSAKRMQAKNTLPRHWKWYKNKKSRLFTGFNNKFRIRFLRISYSNNQNDLFDENNNNNKKDALLSSCSSHVNNQSWILNLPIFFIFKGLHICFFGKITKNPVTTHCFLYFDLNRKLLHPRKNKQKNCEKIGRFRIQDWLLTFDEHDRYTS